MFENVQKKPTWKIVPKLIKTNFHPHLEGMQNSPTSSSAHKQCIRKTNKEEPPQGALAGKIKKYICDLQA